MISRMGVAISVRLIAFLFLGLLLYGIARLIGVADTPQLITMAAFLSAVIIVVAEAVRKLVAKPADSNKKSG